MGKIPHHIPLCPTALQILQVNNNIQFQVLMSKQSQFGYFHIISVLQTQILQQIQSATLWESGYSALEWRVHGDIFIYIGEIICFVRNQLKHIIGQIIIYSRDIMMCF